MSGSPELPPIAYLDSSALVKLVIPEPESGALRDELRRWPRRASSSLVRAELVRACRRVDEAAAALAREVLDGLSLISVSDELLDDASRVEPSTLRTLDSIHVATARLLGGALGAVVTYDDRLADAASRAGLPVLAPA